MFSTRTRLLGVAALLLASTALAAEPKPPVDPKLLGPWHTVSIDGDALFLIVHGAELDFDASGAFTTRIRFTDGSTEVKTGHYTLDGTRIELSIPSMKTTESATYAIEGKDLVFHDASFGVTIKVARGKATDPTGHDLF